MEPKIAFAHFRVRTPEAWTPTHLTKDVPNLPQRSNEHAIEARKSLREGFVNGGSHFSGMRNEKTLYRGAPLPYLENLNRRLLLVRAAPWSNPTGGGPMKCTRFHRL